MSMTSKDTASKSVDLSTKADSTSSTPNPSTSSSTSTDGGTDTKAKVRNFMRGIADQWIAEHKTEVDEFKKSHPNATTYDIFEYLGKKYENDAEFRRKFDRKHKLQGKDEDSLCSLSCFLYLLFVIVMCYALKFYYDLNMPNLLLDGIFFSLRPNIPVDLLLDDLKFKVDCDFLDVLNQRRYQTWLIKTVEEEEEGMTTKTDNEEIRVMDALSEWTESCRVLTNSINAKLLHLQEYHGDIMRPHDHLHAWVQFIILRHDANVSHFYSHYNRSLSNIYFVTTIPFLDQHLQRSVVYLQATMIVNIRQWWQSLTPKSGLELSSVLEELFAEAVHYSVWRHLFDSYLWKDGPGREPLGGHSSVLDVLDHVWTTDWGRVVYPKGSFLCFVRHSSPTWQVKPGTISGFFFLYCLQYVYPTYRKIDCALLCYLSKKKT
ncbi:hypothetical protein RFI_23864 [Reticulomyxa filosa]|uniref:Uncharacterized protein n=1 Tax=Reticulomyxa filosa TaxID=46433 RepID=X6MJ91_RETFI|nr:hypothetical protein RFI_23864 [Reticulomyxa filosa]|eukprot:ETO13502.1 hypothetical protein RFI_23864 [Reticulomyxa filosa]